MSLWPGYWAKTILSGISTSNSVFTSSTKLMDLLLAQEKWTLKRKLFPNNTLHFTKKILTYMFCKGIICYAKKNPNTQEMYLAIKRHTSRLHFISRVKGSSVEMDFDLGLILLKWAVWVSPHATEIQQYYYYYGKNNDCLHVKTLGGKNTLEVDVYSTINLMLKTQEQVFAGQTIHHTKEDWNSWICPSNRMLLYVLNFYLSVLK